MDVIKNLFSSRRVWLALVALLVVFVGVAFPSLPASVIESVRVFALTLIAAFTVEDTAKAIANRRQ